MPFYEYECSACKHHTEVLQKISDAPLKKCPECGKQALKRLISAPVFRLKGGGWYETDFKSDSETKRNIAGREEAAESKSEDAKPKAEAGKDSAKPAEAKATEVKPAQTTASGGSASTKAGSGAARSKAAKSKPKPKPAAKKRRR